MTGISEKDRRDLLEAAHDEFTPDGYELVARLLREHRILCQCVDAVMGHGVTLPMAGNYSEEYSRGYARGVDSQRHIIREAQSRGVTDDE